MASGLNGFVVEFLIRWGVDLGPPWWAWPPRPSSFSPPSTAFALPGVFWGPLTREENRRIPEIRGTELVAAAVLVVLMVWIGVRPNDFLDRLRPSVEQVRRSVATRKTADRAPVVLRLATEAHP